MTTTQTAAQSDIGPRPAPHLIRFDRDCFEAVGTELVYVVAAGTIGYPKEFGCAEEAEAWAKKTRRTVSVREKTVYRRVKWF